MSKIKWVIFGLLALMLLIIIFQNLETTQMRVLFTTISMPQAALLAVTLAMGIVMGWLGSALWRYRKWHAQNQLSKAKEVSKPA